MTERKTENFVTLNCALTENALRFDPQLPLGKKEGTDFGIPEGEEIFPAAEFLDNGNVRISFLAEKAGKMTVTAGNTEYEMEQEKRGVWQVEFPPEMEGFLSLRFRLDGAEALNPMLPVGFGGSRPINYVNIPGKEQDFWMYRSVPHGAVTEEYYESAITGCVRKCLVYTPPGYMKETENDYPVLYLQHGHGENEKCWIYQGKANLILDNLLADGKIRPFIAVMNNGMVQRQESGERKLDTSVLPEVLVKDCIPFIESHYRVKTDKWNRAVAGLSMGSLHASITGLRYPEKFGYVGVFSGFVSPIPDLYRGSADYMKELDDRKKFEEDYRCFFRAVGDADGLALPPFRKDTELFEKKGLGAEISKAHHIRVYPGDHEWNVWRMCLRDFAQYLFQEEKNNA